MKRPISSSLAGFAIRAKATAHLTSGRIVGMSAKTARRNELRGCRVDPTNQLFKWENLCCGIYLTFGGLRLGDFVRAPTYQYRKWGNLLVKILVNQIRIDGCACHIALGHRHRDAAPHRGNIPRRIHPCHRRAPLHIDNKALMLRLLTAE